MTPFVTAIDITSYCKIGLNFIHLCRLLSLESNLLFEICEVKFAPIYKQKPGNRARFGKIPPKTILKDDSESDCESGFRMVIQNTVSSSEETVDETK